MSQSESERPILYSSAPAISKNANNNTDIFCLEKYSLEDVVEFKISRFLDQIGGFYPENLHELIMSKLEKPLISQILRRVGGNQVHAAKILGMNRNTLRRKIKIYGL